MRKLNILQSGGGVYFSSVANPYSAAAQKDQQAALTTSSSKDDGLIPKELLKMLGEKGIPTDVNKFYGMLADFERKAEFGLGVNKRQLYALQAYANQIIKQSEYLNTAEKRADENGALDEFAVDAKGFLYVPTEDGRIQKIHASQFDAGKYQALTVGELLEYRKFSPDLVDDSSIATTVGNNIGIEKINDYIQGILKAVGSTDDASEAYVNLGSVVGRTAARKPNQQQMEALKDLYQLSQQIGPEAIFKMKDQYKTKNMQAAMSYIMSMLPNNIRTQLVARNVAAGGKYENSTKYAANIIGMAAEAANDTKISQGIDYDASINKAAGTDSEKTKTHNLTMAELLFNGDLNNTQIKITDPNYKNNFALVANGTVIPALVNDKNEAVTNAPLSLALSGRGLGKYLDFSQAYVGFDKVSEGMLQNILYTSDEVANVWLPTDAVGNIDWNAFHSYAAAEAEIQEKHITDPIQKNQVHMSKGSQTRYDSSGNIVQNQRMQQFLMTHGYTIDDLIDSKNTLTRELKGQEEDDVDQLFGAVYSKKLKKDTGITVQGKNFWDDIIQVPVFIKISDNAAINAGTFAGYGSQVTNNTLQQDMISQVPQQRYFTASGTELYQ